MPLLKKMSFIVLLSSVLLSCSQKEKSKSINVYLMLSVDWEGDTLRDTNLKAIKEFNKKHSQYPLIHFINPAYYTKSNFMPAGEINKKTRSVLKKSDELGLHIHSWENLIKASGVKFREGPSFWGPKSLGRGGEKGDDVPLNLYTPNEIYKIVKFSLHTLEKNGFSDISSFRGGGWMSGSRVYKALIKAGIHIDSSAVPYKLVENLYPHTGLAKMVKRDWSDITVFSHPYEVHLQKGKIIQFPNNTGLADYVDGNEFFKNYLQHIEKAKKEGKKNIYMHFGFHQESAVEYFEHQKNGQTKLIQAHFLKRVDEALNQLEKHAAKNDHKIIPTTFNKFPKVLIDSLL